MTRKVGFVKKLTVGKLQEMLSDLDDEVEILIETEWGMSSKDIVLVCEDGILNIQYCADAYNTDLIEASEELYEFEHGKDEAISKYDGWVN